MSYSQHSFVQQFLEKVFLEKFYIFQSSLTYTIFQESINNCRTTIFTHTNIHA